MMTQTVDDQVVQVLSGDLDAYRELVRKFEPMVFRMMVPVLGDRHRAEDLVQEVFLKAYQKLDRYELGRSFGAWIQGIARNQLRTELRTRSRENARMNVYRTYLNELTEDDPDLQEEMEDALHSCREHLPEAAATAISLRYDHEESLDRVAASLGRTVNATQQLLYRARLLLRDCIRKRVRTA